MKDTLENALQFLSLSAGLFFFFLQNFKLISPLSLPNSFEAPAGICAQQSRATEQFFTRLEIVQLTAVAHTEGKRDLIACPYILSACCSVRNPGGKERTSHGKTLRTVLYPMPGQFAGTWEKSRDRDVKEKSASQIFKYQLL